MTITPEDTGHRWRNGLGYGFEELNQVICMTGNIPPGWEENPPLIILNQKAKKFLQQENHTGMRPQPNPQVHSNHRNRREQPSIPPQQPSPPQLTQRGTPNDQNNNRPRHPDPQINAWQTRVRRAIGFYEFLTDPQAEERDYASHYPNGCYYCLMGNYRHTTCNILRQMKQQAEQD
eukprot:3635437-Ditylum_brightwellii.AAC.1